MSESFAWTSIVTAVSSGVDAASSLATGASLTAVIVTVTAEPASRPSGSRTVYWKVTWALESGAGVKVTVPSPLITTEPPAAGWVTATTVSGSRSGSVSLASTARVTGASSAVVALS